MAAQAFLSNFVPFKLRRPSVSGRRSLSESQDCGRMTVQREGGNKKFWISQLPSTSQTTEQAITFAEYNEQGLCLNDHALKMLETISKPVAVLAICGPFRSGKSYYLSRVLGNVGNELYFKTSSSSDPCTKGIWIATSVLECEDFVVILMDTEGTTSLEGQERECKVTSFMVLSTLLSSVLVYNSQGAAKQSDLNEMSFFGHLAENFVVREGESVPPEDKCINNFPDLLWLLRDNSFTNTDSHGVKISPTEHIKTKILQPSGPSSTTNAVSRALLTLFPSLECKQIPSPLDDDPASVSAENLRIEFNMAIEDSVKYILTKIKPRKGVNNDVELDGSLLAELARQYTKSLNVPNSVPNLEVSYECAVKYKMNELSNSLTECYQKEMRRELSQNKYPLEEGNFEETRSPSKGHITLFNIHNKIYQPKFDLLQKQVQTYMASSNFDGDRERVVNTFRDRICKVVDNKVQQGSLQVFVTENFYESLNYCTKTFQQVYYDNSKVINLQEIKRLYLAKAIGPAKFEVLQEKLSVIPSAPTRFTEKEAKVKSVTVTWDIPDVSPKLRDTLSYELDVKTGGTFKKVFTFPEGSNPPQTLTGLSPNTTYVLRIRACNCNNKGEYSQELKVKTRIGKPSKPDKPKIMLESPSNATIGVNRLSKEQLNGAKGIDRIIVEHSYRDDDDEWISNNVIKVKSDSKPINAEIALPTVPPDSRSLYYRVCVVTTAGKSEPSDPEEVLTADLIPGPPTSLKYSSYPEKRQAVLSWNTPRINSQSVVMYHIKVSQDNGEEEMFHDVCETKITLKVLKPATNYSVKLFAFNHQKRGACAECTIKMKAAKPAKPKKPRIQLDREDIRQAFLIVERLSNDEENGSAIKNIIVETAKGEDSSEKWIPKRHNATIGDRNIRLPVKLVNATETKTMYFRVVMENGVGQSEASGHCELEYSQMIPGEPQNVCIHHATNNSVTLKWDKPEVNPKSVDYYHVQMSEQNRNEWIAQSHIQPLKQLSFTVQNLHQNTPYTFQVLAYNKDNESLPSSQVRHTVEAHTHLSPPNKPDYSRIILKIIDPTSATIFVPRPSIEDSGSDVTAIYCEKITENGECIPDLTEEALCEDEEREIIRQKIKIDDQTHYLRVGLKNAEGLSQLSEHICVSASDIKPGPPQVDEILCNDVAHNSLILSWNPPKEQARAAKTYLVEINKSEDEAQWRTAEYVHTVIFFQHCATIRGLEPITKYYFRVYALNGELKSCESNIVTATTVAGRPEKPRPPTIIQLTKNPEKASMVVPTLHKTEENGSAIKKIKVEYCNENTNWLLCEEKCLEREPRTPNINLEINVPNLEQESGRVLYFRIKMINDVGESQPSDPETAKLITADLMPGCVQDLQAKDTSDNCTTITWKAPTVHPGIVQMYIIECRESDAEGWKEIARSNSDQKSCTLLDLQCYKAYNYRVTACSNSRGIPKTITVKTLDIIPLAPHSLQLDRKWSDAIKIRWSKPLGGCETNDAYKIVLIDKKSNGEKLSRTYCTRGHSKVLNDLVSSTSYSVEVKGISKSKKLSEDSKTDTFSTAMSGWGRFAATAAGSVGFIVGGIAVYQATKPDKEEYNVESDEECDERYKEEVEKRNLQTQ